MHYATVFTPTDNLFRNCGFAAFGLLFVVVGALMVFRPQVLIALGFRDMGKYRAVFGWFYFLFALLWTVIAGFSVVGGSIIASWNLNSGNCQNVEGVVDNFQPGSGWTGKNWESFSVRGVTFEYSDGEVAPGFNRTASHGGPIRQGLPVRICYRDGQILRLEVAQ
jgi:hypothetical protein